MALSPSLQTQPPLHAKQVRNIMKRAMNRVKRGIVRFLYLTEPPVLPTFPAKDSPLTRELSPVIDEVPTFKQELPRTPSGRLLSEEQLLTMFTLGKKQGRQEVLSGPAIHQVPVPVAPVCEACLKRGELVPLWKDTISPYESYSYCPKCSIQQGRHYTPSSPEKLREQIAVRRILSQQQQQAFIQKAAFTPFKRLDFGCDTAEKMQAVQATEEQDQFLNESVEETVKREAIKKEE